MLGYSRDEEKAECGKRARGEAGSVEGNEEGRGNDEHQNTETAARAERRF